MDNLLILEVTVDVAASVGGEGLIVCGCPPDFLHLVAPGVVVETTIQLNLKHQSAKSVVMRTDDHTLTDGSSLRWDVNRDDVTEADVLVGGAVHGDRHVQSEMKSSKNEDEEICEK